MTQETSLAGPILCPVDFSELSAEALEMATLIGTRCSCAVKALHAQWFEVPPYLTPGQVEQIREQLRHSLDAARTALQGFVAGRTEGTAPELLVEEGNPVDVILRTSRTTGAKLIVMGTHGRTGVRRWTLGSVAEEVLHESNVPVLTLRHTGRTNKLDHVVSAVNDSELSQRALLYAARLAQCVGAKLTVVHVKDGEESRVIGDLCAWISQRNGPACALREITRQGNAGEQILTLLEELHADLLVIGNRHKAFFDRTMVGATTAHLVRHAPSAILTVPGGAGRNAGRG